MPESKKGALLQHFFMEFVQKLTSFNQSTESTDGDGCI